MLYCIVWIKLINYHPLLTILYWIFSIVKLFVWMVERKIAEYQ